MDAYTEPDPASGYFPSTGETREHVPSFLISGEDFGTSQGAFETSAQFV